MDRELPKFVMLEVIVVNHGPIQCKLERACVTETNAIFREEMASSGH